MREAWFGPAHKLSGQLDRPVRSFTARDPYPLVILIPPGGGIDRDGSSNNLSAFEDVYLPLVQAVVDQGWAIFRYDRSGSGNSEESDRPNHLDALDAVRVALEQPFVDPSRVVIIAQGGGTGMLHNQYAAFEELVGFRNLRGVVLLSSMTGGHIAGKMAGDLLIVMGSNDEPERLASARNAVELHERYRPGTQSRCVVVESASHALCGTGTEGWTDMRGFPGTCVVPEQVWQEIVKFLKRVE
jgi:hypothetical protein